MKHEDDYNAKYAIWTAECRVPPIPKIANLPRFASRKFNSYEEMNAWKREIIAQLIRNGGAEWTT